MQDLTREFLELIRLASTDLPADVEARLRQALADETPGSAACRALETILANVELARQKSVPICQDTGTPLFYIQHPVGWSARELIRQVRSAVAEATRLAYLRPNAVDAVSGKNSGDNLGDEHFPTIHLIEVDGEDLAAELILKGGGCENVGAQVSLPSARLKAGRDLEGVRRAALDAVFNAQGEGCPPGFLGVALGGDRGSSYLASKEALTHPLDESNPNPELKALEERITREANELGIGPMGFGGKTTLLGTRVVSAYRLPASYFVSVSYMCWAYRRRRMVVSHGLAVYS